MLPDPKDIYSKIKNDEISLAEAERQINMYANYKAIEAIKEIREKNGCSINKEIEEGILRIHQKLDELIENTLEALSIAKEAEKI